MNRVTYGLCLVFAPALVVLSACEDEAPRRRRSAADTGADVGVVDASVDGAPSPFDGAPRAEDATPRVDAATPDAEPPAPPPVGWVEVTLSPRRPVYGPEDEVTASARVFAVTGALLDAHPVTFDAVPAGVTSIDALGRVSWSTEGPGVVRACTADAVCGETAFWVDAGPPKLTITAPETGSALGGDQTSTIRVRGNAVDSSGEVVVRVNGEVVGVEPNGDFLLDLPARFGVNHVEVTADDGVRRPPTRATRDVLWAPRWVRAEVDHVTLPGAGALRLDQSLLDGNQPLPVLDAAQVALPDLASLLTAALALAEPDALLPQGPLSEGDVLRLSIQGVELGAPEVELRVVPEGLELFLRLGDIRVATAGAFAFQGESIALDGTLVARVSAFALIDITAEGGALLAAHRASGVVVEGIEGRFADPAANALVDTLGGRLRGLVEALVEGVIIGVVRDQLPTLLSEGLQGLVGGLARLPVELNTGIVGAPVASLVLGLTPARVSTPRETHIGVELDARVGQRGPVVAPSGRVPGVPALEASPTPRALDAQVGLLLRLELLNALLHEVWRTGLLQLELPLPEALAATLGRVTIDARLPPVVAPALPASDWPLEAQIGALQVEIRAPAAERGDVYMVRLAAGLTLAPDDTGALSLSTEAEPRVDAELVEQADDQPVVTPDALEVLFATAVWPQLEQALAGGLAVTLPEIQVDAGAFAGFAPRLQSLTLRPDLSAPPRLVDGWLVLAGDLALAVGVAP